MNARAIVRSIGNTLGKHSPEIFTGLGVFGLGVTIIFAVEATPKAIELIKEAEAEKQDKLTALETVKVAWKPYIPTAISVTTSALCIINGNRIGNKRSAALAAAYKVSETALLEYKDAVVEKFGKDGAEEVMNQVSENRVKKAQQSFADVSFDDEHIRCIDGLTNKPFISNRNKIEKAINDLNDELANNMYISLNEYFVELGLDACSLGNEFGWTSPDRLDIYINCIMDDMGRPCLCVEHYNMPTLRYRYGDLG